VTVFITAPSLGAAEKLALGILQAKLAACASILPGVHSLFWWKGDIESADETLIICKTRMALSEQLTEFVKRNHEYDVPEVVVLPIIDGNPDYLEWLKESTVE
jgi:periplasmic divalent cation tolerance protein